MTPRVPQKENPPGFESFQGRGLTRVEKDATGSAKEMKMTQIRNWVRFISLAAFMLLFGVWASAQVNVLTQHNDNGRTGANLNETTLNTSNINVNQFGLLFKLAVDDQVYASPLYVANLNIGGGTHNVVYVATVNNTVFAFDADRGTALWTRNFNNGGRPTDHTEVGTGGLCATYTDFTGHIGIVGTPVIDTSTDTMYFVARTVEASGTVQRLRAIDITTGNDRASAAQVVIQANGFNPVIQNQRPALTLSQGTVYVAWSSFCDFGAYHGFVIGYNASTFQQVHVFNDTPSGSQAGIWQAGQGASVDANGALYYMTGNGTFDGSSNFGESFLKLNPSTGLSLQDWFAPSDFAAMNNGDRDLGSAGPLLIPGTNLIVGGGKDGIFYLLDTNNMGHEVANDTQIVQKFQATFVHNGCATLHIHGSPVFWNSNTNGQLIYVWGENDFLRQFKFSGVFNTSAFHTSTMTAATCGMPGCQLSVSANGGAAGSGVLWANCVLSGDANHSTTPGIFRAFNADDVSQELWDSQQNAGRDSCNNYSKYSYPVVANGKTYLSSFGTAARDSGQVCVYGELPVVHVTNINCGGPAAGSFAADIDFNGGGTINHANTIDLSGVTNPAPMAVYQSARVTSTFGAGGNFSYTLTGFTAGSNHTVRLHFAETFWTAAGKRVFNVSINGTQVLTNFDIFAAAGAGNKAVIKQFSAAANGSGQFNIVFTTVTDKALISGIEIQ